MRIRQLTKSLQELTAPQAEKAVASAPPKSAEDTLEVLKDMSTRMLKAVEDLKRANVPTADLEAAENRLSIMIGDLEQFLAQGGDEVPPEEPEETDVPPEQEPTAGAKEAEEKAKKEVQVAQENLKTFDPVLENIASLVEGRSSLEVAADRIFDAVKERRGRGVVVWLDLHGNLSATNFRGVPLGPSLIKRGTSLGQAQRLANLLRSKGLKARLKMPKEGERALGFDTQEFPLGDLDV